jgi:hypothetical protein
MLKSKNKHIFFCNGTLRNRLLLLRIHEVLSRVISQRSFTFLAQTPVCNGATE